MALIADCETPELVDPGEVGFVSSTVLAEVPGAVDAGARDTGHDGALAQVLSALFEIVAPVGEEFLRPLIRTSAFITLRNGGIEGFIEAVAQEVTPFGIYFIIAEPGPTETNFGAGLVRPDPMDVYEETSAGMVRRAVDSGSFDIKGDAQRTVDAMIAAADSRTRPFHLALGSAAFENIVRELSKRLAAIDAQRDVAFSADRPEE